MDIKVSPFINREHHTPPRFRTFSDDYYNQLTRKGMLRRYRNYYRVTDKGYLKGISPDQFHDRRVRG